MGERGSKGVEFDVRLFIAGATPNSSRAVMNIKHILNTYLSDRYTLDIIDVRQEPEMAKHEQIIALPLLIIKHSLQERRLIGDLSNTAKVLEGFGIIDE